MAELKSLCEEAGLSDVRTFLQSGNVLFSTTRKDPAKLIEKALARDVKVIVRSIDELQKVVDRSPFDADTNPSLRIVVFLEKEPSKEAQKALLDSYKGPEEMHFDGSELFVYYVDGQGRSKLTNALIEKKLGMRGTARNWNTVTKLLAMV